jgi:hypothetical protein
VYPSEVGCERMGSLFWTAAVLMAVGFLAWRAGPIWVDAGRRGLRVARRAAWTLLGAIAPSRYWWGARIEAMPPAERDDLLARETAAMGLERADGLSCPLCRSEIPRAWEVDASGRPTVAQGPVECTRCDFRLDSCRYCVHFLPGAPAVWGHLPLGHGDRTFGRCSSYREPQAVEQAYSPQMARQLRARGWPQVRAPLRIIDSYLPPDFCRAFSPDTRRLRADGVRKPDARRVALLRLLAPSPPAETPPPDSRPSEDEQWLL